MHPTLQYMKIQDKTLSPDLYIKLFCFYPLQSAFSQQFRLKLALKSRMFGFPIKNSLYIDLPSHGLSRKDRTKLKLCNLKYSNQKQPLRIKNYKININSEFIHFNVIHIQLSGMMQIITYNSSFNISFLNFYFYFLKIFSIVIVML